MRSMMRKCWIVLRDAEWLTRDRALAYSRILFLFTVVLALMWIGLARHGIDRAGKPLVVGGGNGGLRPAGGGEQG